MDTWAQSKTGERNLRTKIILHSVGGLLDFDELAVLQSNPGLWNDVFCHMSTFWLTFTLKSWNKLCNPVILSSTVSCFRSQNEVYRQVHFNYTVNLFDPLPLNGFMQGFKHCYLAAVSTCINIVWCISGTVHGKFHPILLSPSD